MITKIIYLAEKVEIEAENDCQYMLMIKNHSNKKNSYNFVLNMTYPNISSEIIGIFNLKHNQNLKLNTQINHLRRNTRSQTNIKAVVSDNSQFNYIGKVSIKPQGQDSRAYLECKMLFNKENSEASAKPVLEIEANNVQASHGFAAGRIDDEQIYYLTSRGCSLNEAKNFVISGFFENEINKIYNDKAKKVLSAYIKNGYSIN